MQSILSKIYRALFPVLILTVAGLLFGCAPQTQLSSLQSYNGPLSTHGTNQCFVAKTALNTKFAETINEYKDFIQGDSHIETSGNYEIQEAAFDCMYVGAKSVLILDRGVSSTISGSTAITYHYPSTNTSITHTNSSAISAYTIVFFNKKIPEFGQMITMNDYESWKKSNRIKNCVGCK
ncbi:hypothetical protein [Fibrobacter sp.]|uniref:hypothetical protein n=1 Tax=Fibrobacter sp. TaxID=35828 RepID=UPI00388F1A35